MLFETSNDHMTMLFNELQGPRFGNAQGNLIAAFTTRDMFLSQDRSHITAVVNGLLILNKGSTVTMMVWQHCLYAPLPLSLESNGQLASQRILVRYIRWKDRKTVALAQAIERSNIANETTVTMKRTFQFINLPEISWTTLFPSRLGTVQHLSMLAHRIAFRTWCRGGFWLPQATLHMRATFNAMYSVGTDLYIVHSFAVQYLLYKSECTLFLKYLDALVILDKYWLNWDETDSPASFHLDFI